MSSAAILYIFKFQINF